MTISRHLALSVLLTTLSALGCAQPPAPVVGGSPMPSGLPSATPTAVPSGTESGAPGMFVLTGKVYDDDLTPMAGVSVTASGAANGSVSTDAQGAYTLTLSPGAYQVAIAKEGYAPRSQSVTLRGDTTLDFGGQTTAGGNPYFLTSAPEVHALEVKEDAPGGPLTLMLHMSEALTDGSQAEFQKRFMLLAGTDTEFLRADRADEPYLANTSSWDEQGKTFTFHYDQPYLAGVAYSVKLRQNGLDKRDNVTDEQLFEDMHIVDGQGQALGLGRAEYAFLRQQLQTLTFKDMADKDIGYTPAIRRWRLTHIGQASFDASPDVTSPGLVSAKVERDVPYKGGTFDRLVLHLTEPMRVVKNRKEGQYTLLKQDGDLVVLNVSDNVDGSNPVALTTAVVSRLEFSTSDATLVNLYYPSGTFKNRAWVEVTMGPDMKDPAGNKPDPAKSRATGTVG